MRTVPPSSLAAASRALLLGAFALSVAGQAAAGDRDHPPQSTPPQAQRQEPAPNPQRDRFIEEQRRAQQEAAAQQRAEGFRRNGRLTPDERRDLRRQINEAGQDIYAHTPRH
ncbi:MAG: hypothetical protein ACXU8N_19610 [Telluria sp.]